MEIRKATPADAGSIAGLLNQLGYSQTAECVREKIGQLSGHPDADLAVAALHEEVVGFISIHFIPQIATAGAFARISYLCVDETARANGIGRQLELYCEDLARERQCDRIELHCHDRRTPAHAFYRRQGYEESPKYLVKRL